LVPRVEFYGQDVLLPKVFRFSLDMILLALGRGYGNATRSEDDLKSFRAFLLKDMNKIVVTLRSRELTWIKLKELLMQLD